MAAFKFRHGAAVGDETVEYKTWCRLKNRCLNPNSPDYPYYGERGITVAKEWVDSFEAFFAEVGLRPSPKHSIDRIDNDRGYEPGNCRWATRSEQMRNTRHAAPVVASNGEYFDHISDAMKVYGKAIHQSMAKGCRAGGLTWRRPTEDEIATRRRATP